MMRLRWNIFNGHSDVADRKAAMSRKMQAAAHRDDQRSDPVDQWRLIVAAWGAREASVASAVALEYAWHLGAPFLLGAWHRR